MVQEVHRSRGLWVPEVDRSRRSMCPGGPWMQEVIGSRRSIRSRKSMGPGGLESRVYKDESTTERQAILQRKLL